MSELEYYYAQSIKRTHILSVSEERDLYDRFKAGDKEAKRLLIESSMKTVQKMARKFYRKGVDYFDLVQEGNLGLMHAAETFDTTRKVRFNTYAIFWARQYIMRFYQEKVRMIRIPVDKEQCLHRITQYQDDFTRNFGRLATCEELSVMLGKPVKYVSQLLADTTLCESFESTSLDAETTVQKFFGDVRFCPDTELIQRDDKDFILKMIECLSERDQTIIKMRFGFLDKEYSLKEVGEKFKLSPEACRQIQNKALTKMKEFYQETVGEMD